MTTMNTKYELVPPRNHIANNAERDIKNFKNQFIAGLCSVDKDFHLQLWDRLLQQAKMSIKLLRQSRTLPHISTYTHIFGEFDFSRTPFPPTGTRVVIHNRPNDRALWAPHEEEGWCIGPAMECYRCHKAYILKTRAERIPDTVEPPPKNVICHRCLVWMQLTMPHKI